MVRVFVKENRKKGKGRKGKEIEKGRREKKRQERERERKKQPRKKEMKKGKRKKKEKKERKMKEGKKRQRGGKKVLFIEASCVGLGAGSPHPAILRSQPFTPTGTGTTKC